MTFKTFLLMLTVTCTSNSEYEIIISLANIETFYCFLSHIKIDVKLSLKKYRHIYKFNSTHTGHIEIL